jgi:hypothetical protein
MSSTGGLTLKSVGVKLFSGTVAGVGVPTGEIVIGGLTILMIVPGEADGIVELLAGMNMIGILIPPSAKPVPPASPPPPAVSAIRGKSTTVPIPVLTLVIITASGGKPPPSPVQIILTGPKQTSPVS